MTSAFKRDKMRVPFRVYLRRAVRVWFMLLIIGLIPFLLWYLLVLSHRFHLWIPLFLSVRWVR